MKMKDFSSSISSDILPFLGLYRLEFTNTNRLPFYIVERDFITDLRANEIVFDRNIDQVKSKK